MKTSDPERDLRGVCARLWDIDWIDAQLMLVLEREILVGVPLSDLSVACENFLPAVSDSRHVS